MKFPQGTAGDLLALIRSYPLAWLTSHDDAGFAATPLPLIAETDAAGDLVALIGHCSRANAQVASLRANPRAMVQFMGPQAYVSPGLISRPGWAPTWNYAVATFQVQVDFDAIPTLDAVRQLTDLMEEGQPNPWAVEQAGDRLDPLIVRVVGFRATILSGSASFKLGQDEDPTSYGEIIVRHEDKAMIDWMHRLNPGRGA
jgi:transcriptional regulator